MTIRDYLVLGFVAIVFLWYFVSTRIDRMKTQDRLFHAANFCYIAVDHQIRVYQINGLYPLRVPKEETPYTGVLDKVYRCEYQRPLTIQYAIRKRRFIMQNFHTQKLIQNINAKPDHVYEFTTQESSNQLHVFIKDGTTQNTLS